VQLIQAGTIGKVQSVHSWSSKKWGDGSPRPERADTVPESLDWDLWLGIAEKRPFIGNEYYHPANWRKRLDFGTGTFGDMGCHIFDPVFKALALTAPLTIRSTGPAPRLTTGRTTPSSISRFRKPAYDRSRDPHHLVRRRPAAIERNHQADSRRSAASGSRIDVSGSSRALLLPHVSAPELLPADKFADTPRPRLEEINHWHQFVEAVRGNGKTSAHFGYAGPLTESVLLGVSRRISPISRSNGTRRD